MPTFYKCRLVSDDEMQSLWSKILAEEANKSGSFSKRTVELVTKLSKDEANFFTKLMQYMVLIDDDVYLLILDINNEIYSNSEITFSALTHLDNIGLIKFDSDAEFGCIKLPKLVKVDYFGRTITIELLNEENNELLVGCVLLTQAGNELARICGASSCPDFLDYVLKEWGNKGYVVSRE